MKGVIPTGGRGTRMYPVTYSENKHFIPVANKPLIFYPIETLAEAGIRKIAVTYNPGWLERVKSILGTGSKWGVRFTYILQERPIGLANIFQVCEEYLGGEPFVFHLGDNIFTDGIKDQASYFLKKRPNALLTVIKVKKGENTRMGVPRFDPKGKLKEYVEKPEKPPNDYGIAGLYFFDNNVFKCFKGKDKIAPSERGEYEISAPYNWLISHGHRVDVIEYQGTWLDPGKFDDWLAANRYLLDQNVDGRDSKKYTGNGNKIEGRVEIGKKCRINNSVIRGPVSIGDNVKITSSIIGPYSSIYNDCVIEESRVDNSVLMEGVVIKNVDGLIESSIIGSGSDISKNGKVDQLEFFLGTNSKISL